LRNDARDLYATKHRENSKQQRDTEIYIYMSPAVVPPPASRSVGEAAGSERGWFTKRVEHPEELGVVQLGCGWGER